MRFSILRLAAILAACFLLHVSLTAQTVSIISPNLADFTVCGDTQYISLHISTSNVDSARFAIARNGFAFADSVKATNGTVRVEQGQDSVIFVTAAGVDTLHFSLSAGCGLISAFDVNASIAIVARLYSSSGVASSQLTSNNFSVSSPFLSVVDIENQQINGAGVSVGQSYRRRFTIVNTGNKSFSGGFAFSTNTGGGLALRDFGSETALAGSSLTISDSSASLKGLINNMAVGDSLVLYDTVFIDDCTILDTDLGKSSYLFRYGCDTTDLCNNLTVENTFIDAGSVKPTISFTQLSGDTTCFSGTDTAYYSFIVVNEGNIAAKGFVVDMVGGAYSLGIMMVDFNEIKITHKDTALHTQSISLYNHCSIGTALASGRWILPALEPGDTIQINYKTVDCCGNVPRVASIFHTIRLASENPCSTTGFGYSGFTRYYHSRMEQTFENYIATLSPPRLSTAPPLISKFEISNDNARFLQSNLGVFNTEHMAFDIELELDKGFILLDSTLVFQSNVDAPFQFTWKPCKIEKVLTNAPNPGGGDRIIARFCFPDMFELLIGSTTLDSLNLFLGGNSKVLFSLQAICPAEQPLASITQRVYFHTDTTCSGDCGALISEQSTEIAILCPGCLIPGYIAQGFSLERINIGRRDTNNNRWPDDPGMFVSADSLANTKRVIVGDTLEAIVSANLWGGQDVNIPDLTFDFKSTIVRFGIGGDLQFIDSLEVIIQDVSASVNDSFTIPVSALNQNFGFVDLFLHVDSLRSQGLNPGMLFFDNQDVVRVRGKLVVVDDISDGYQQKTVSAQVFASGTASYSNALSDANVIYQGCTDTASSASCASGLDSTMLFWCEATAAKIGQYRATLSPFAFGKNNYNISQTGCTQNYNITSVAYPGSGSRHNIFDFEVRELLEIDTIRFNKASGFDLESIIITQTFWVKEDGAEVRKFELTQLNRADIFEDALGYYALPSSLQRDTTDYSSSDSSPYPLNVDELIETNIYYEFSASSSEKLIDSIVAINTSLVYGKLPDPSTPKEYGFATSDGLYALWLTPLDLTTSSISPDTIVQNDRSVSWDVRIVNNLDGVPFYPGRTRKPSRWGENTFLSIISPSGKVNISDVLDANGNPFPEVNGIYQIDDFLKQEEFHDIQIVGSYDCSTSGLALDSILVIDGWNCDGFPTSLDSVCHKDTLVLYVEPSVAGLQASFSAQDTANICDTVEYSLLLEATGRGKIFDIEAGLNLPTGLSYIPGSGQARYPYNPGSGAGTTEALEPDTSGLFEFENLSNLGGRGFFFDNTDSTNLFLTFKLEGGCGFSGEAVSLDIDAVNYCGDRIDFQTNGASPSVLEQVPQLDSLNIDLSTGAMDFCGDSLLVTVNIDNIGSKPTGSNNRLEVELPMGFVYSSGAPWSSYSGQTLNFSLSPNTAVGVTESIAFYIYNPSQTGCDSAVVNGTLFVAESFSCNGSPCIYEPPGGIALIRDTLTNILLCSTEVVQAVSCHGLSDAQAKVLIQGGLAPYSYLWSDGQTTETATGLGSGSYTVTVSDRFGSSTSCGITISEPDSLYCIASELKPVTCHGANNGEAQVAGYGGTGSYNYLWSDNQNTPTATGLAAGNYTVQVQDSLGCVSSCSASISQPGMLVCNASADKPETCAGDADGQASVSSSGGNGGYSYLWSDGQTTAVATGLSAGSYSVTVSDSSGCTCVSTSVIVGLKPVPTAPSSSIITCSGEPINFDLQAWVDSQGNAVASTFSWQANVVSGISGISTSPQTGPLISDIPVNNGLLAKTVVYTILPSSDPGGCIGTPFNLTVTVPVATALTALPANSCLGNAVDIARLVRDYRFAINQFWFYDDDPAVGGTMIGTARAFRGVPRSTDRVFVNPASAGTYQYYVVGAATAGNTICYDTAVIVLTVQQPPVALNMPDMSFCGNSATLINFSNTNGTVHWTSDNLQVGIPASGTGNISTPTPVDSAGNALSTHIITQVHHQGCISEPDTFVVSVKPIPVLTIANQSPYCSNVPVNIGIQANLPGTILAWTSRPSTGGMNRGIFGLGLNTIVDSFVNKTGQTQQAFYQLFAIAPNNCSNIIDTLALDILPEPVIASPQAQTVCSGETSSLVPLETSGLATSYRWVDGYGNAGSGAAIDTSIINSNSSPLYVDFIVTPVSSAGCEGDTGLARLTVSPANVVKDTIIKACMTGSSGTIDLPARIAGRAVLSYEGLPPPYTTYTGQDQDSLIAVLSGTGNCSDIARLILSLQPRPARPGPAMTSRNVCGSVRDTLYFGNAANVYADASTSILLAQAVSLFDTLINPGQQANLFVKGFAPLTGCESELASHYQLHGRSLPTVSAQADQSSYCMDSVNNIIGLDGSVSGNGPFQSTIWSHAGGLQIPAVDTSISAAGMYSGTNTLRFTTTDVYGCASSTQVSFHVDTIAYAGDDIMVPSAFCITDTSTISLFSILGHHSQHSPGTGGVWAGPIAARSGHHGTIRVSDLPGPGTWHFTYGLTSPYPCAVCSKATVTINVVSCQPKLAAKALLEGAYTPQSGIMRDNLRSQGLIPLQEPYTALGYAFVQGGGETIQSGILQTMGNNAIVDWVLVEFRDSTDNRLIVYSRAALVQRDGDIVDLDGVSPIHTSALPTGNYHIAVLHRNHLGNMTAQPIYIGNQLVSLDFSSANSQVYGGNQSRCQHTAANGTTRCMLISGDADMNGQIQNTDNVLHWVPTAGTAGYKDADFNMNGQVQNTDRILLWMPSVGQGGTVPR